jgi:hypothetical protein
MLAFLKDKRAECEEDVAVCEEELREAKTRLNFLDELIREAEDAIEEPVVSNS